MANQNVAPETYTRIIKSDQPVWDIGLVELWQYRHMLYYLILRDFTANYKQTVLGPLWVIITPLVTMVLFTFVFGSIARVETYDIPYPVFSYTALIPWTLFSTIVLQGTMSISKNANMISKVYFPRLAMPFVEVGVSLVNTGIGFLSLFLLMLLFGYVPTWNIIWIPVLLLIIVLTALGVALWMAPLNVWSRDVQRGITFVITAWMYFSPVAYPREQAPEFIAKLMGFNPMTTALEGFRWALLGLTAPDISDIILASIISIVLFSTGLLFFNRMEKTFADVI